MDNKDFRAKLREHETPFNPEAWNQMEEMLGALPAEETQEGAKKYTSILLLLLFLTTILIIILWNNNTSNSSSELIEVEQTNSNNKGSNTENNISNPTSGNKNTRDNQTINNSYLNNKGKEDTKNDNSTSSLGSNNTRSNQTTYNSTLIREPKSLNIQKRLGSSIVNNKTIKSDQGDITKTDSSEEAELKNNSSSYSNPDSPINGNESNPSFLNNIPYSKSTTKTTDENQQLLSDSNPSALQSSDMEFVSEDVKDILLRKFESIEFLNGLELRPLTNHRKAASLDAQPTIDIPKRLRLYWTGELGWADNNSNRGVRVAGGIFWDINKVLGLESNLSFASTNQTLASNSLFQGDRQIRLEAWLHLNLIRINNHKLSLELAPALVAEWTKLRPDFTLNPNPPFELDAFISYHFGLSYSHFINQNHGVGIKGSFSLDDGGFITLKYFKRI